MANLGKPNQTTIVTQPLDVVSGYPKPDWDNCQLMPGLTDTSTGKEKEANDLYFTYKNKNKW